MDSAVAQAAAAVASRADAAAASAGLVFPQSPALRAALASERYNRPLGYDIRLAHPPRQPAARGRHRIYPARPLPGTRGGAGHYEASLHTGAPGGAPADARP